MSKIGEAMCYIIIAISYIITLKWTVSMLKSFFVQFKQKPYLWQWLLIQSNFNER